MTEYADCHWSSRDGLRLHYRDYPGRKDRPAVICLPGLTRTNIVTTRHRGDEEAARQYFERFGMALDPEDGTPGFGWAIAPGKSADIIAVASDPVADVTVLKKIDFVMARGTVVD